MIREMLIGALVAPFCFAIPAAIVLIVAGWLG